MSNDNSGFTNAAMSGTLQFAGGIRKPSQYIDPKNSNIKGAMQLSVNLNFLTDAEVAAAEATLEANGVTLMNNNGTPRIKTNKEGIRFLPFKRSAVHPKTGEANSIEVLDAAGVAMDEVFLGDGTKAIIHFFTYDTGYPSKAFQFSKVQVTDLIEFIPKSNSVEAVDGHRHVAKAKATPNDINALLDEENTQSGQSLSAS